MGGQITEQELQKVYAARGFRPPWTEMRDRRVLQKVTQEKVSFKAKDALLYHDADNDGKLTLDEFEDSAVKFTAVKHRGRTIKKLRQNRKKLFSKEKEWLRKYVCTDDDCPQLKQLQMNFEGKLGRT